ncbi:MAG: pseudouridine synthase [bacterium]|nr:pseudouridine synthase [bacterium]
MRLNKFIAKAGISSRRKADILIEKGKVKINGKLITTLGIDVDVEKDIVEIEGKTLKIEYPLLVALNKPPGYVTTLEDRHADLIITDLIQDIKLRLFPVGRLDKDAEGLILLTNNGDIAYRLTHPKFEMEKEYLVWTDGNLDWTGIKTLEKGIEWEGEILTAKKVELLENRKIKIILTEGKKREIKNMIRALGCTVIRLQRIRIGKMGLGDLEMGKYRIYKMKDMDLQKQSQPGQVNVAAESAEGGNVSTPYDYFLSLII